MEELKQRVLKHEGKDIIGIAVFMSWKNVIFIPLSTWKSVFCLLFMYVLAQAALKDKRVCQAILAHPLNLYALNKPSVYAMHKQRIIQRLLC